MVFFTGDFVLLVEFFFPSPVEYFLESGKDPQGGRRILDAVHMRTTRNSSACWTLGLWGEGRRSRHGFRGIGLRRSRVRLDAGLAARFYSPPSVDEFASDVEPKNIPTHGNPSTVRLIEVLLPSGLDDICLRVVKIDVSAEEYMSLSGHR